MTIWPPLTDILAHRPPLLLLTRIVDASAETLDAEYQLEPDAWYADAQGNMPCWIGVEVMAQGVAAYVGLEGWQHGRPFRQGVLLGTRAYVTNLATFAQGVPLHVHVVMQFRDEGGLGAFACELSQAGKVVASAILKVFEPADFAAFLEAA